MIFIVLPAFNEETAIGPLLEAIRRTMQERRGLAYEVVVVNDGSSDRTVEVARQFESVMALELVNHTVNRGLAETLKSGLLYVLQKCEKGDVVVTMDADNTHTPDLIIRMLGLIESRYDVVIASRYQPGARVIGVPIYRRFLSSGASFLFRTLFPIHGVKDYTCGYRAYEAEALKQAVDLYGNAFINQEGFSCMVDILLKMRRLGLSMTEVPLVLRYDLKDGMSKMKVLRTIRETLALVVKRILRG